MHLRKFAIVLAHAVAAHAGATRIPAQSATMSFEEYDPPSTLVVPASTVTRARFPFIDVHSHHRDMSPQRADALVREMDALNMAVLVNLTGGTGADLGKRVQATRARHAARFVTFANLDFNGIDQPGWGERAAAQLERDVKESGAQGLKIFKNLGLDLRDARGRVPTDDPRLDPVWRKAGELGIPVLIHTGEPKPFFEPHDARNERWLELKEFPSRARPADRYPSWEQIMREQHNVFRKHRETTFIAAHLDWLGNDLGRLGKFLDEHPNVYTEIAAAIAELGRQPRFARAWFIKYQDRVMFGKDTYEPVEYHTYFRVLESADEYFDYFRRRHAFWKMYGLELPDDVLRKLYYKNALRVIPGIDRRLFPE